MSIINLLLSDVWSPEDIEAHGRAVINSHVSVERQDELRTIMLGHLANMRHATAGELAEIANVQSVYEHQVLDNAAAKVDMALLQNALDCERAAVRLLVVPVIAPLHVHQTDSITGAVSQVANPAIALDAGERNAAQAVLDGATTEVLELLRLRTPPATPELEQP